MTIDTQAQAAWKGHTKHYSREVGECGCAECDPQAKPAEQPISDGVMETAKAVLIYVRRECGAPLYGYENQQNIARLIQNLVDKKVAELRAANAVPLVSNSAMGVATEIWGMGYRPSHYPADAQVEIARLAKPIQDFVDREREFALKANDFCERELSRQIITLQGQVRVLKEALRPFGQRGCEIHAGCRLDQKTCLDFPSTPPCSTCAAHQALAQAEKP